MIDETKKCCICNNHLPADTKHFHVDNSSASKLSSQCKTCRATYMSAYRKKNLSKLNKQGSEWRRQYKRERMLSVLIYLKDHGCIDCNEKDPICLDFDHVSGEKLYNVSEMLHGSFSKKKIFEEIAKCVVRCSNCHRKKTAKEKLWYDYIDFNTMTISHNDPKERD